MRALQKRTIYFAEYFSRFHALLFGSVATSLVTGIVLLAFTVVPGRMHLSLVAETDAKGILRVTEVMPASYAYDAGLRGGETIIKFDGGKVEEKEGRLALYNPVQVEVIMTSIGTVRRISIKDAYWIGNIGPGFMAVVALVYVLSGSTILNLRRWDKTTLRAFLFFSSVSLTLSLGIFSGAWGGEVAVFFEIVVTLMVGYSSVWLIGGFPRQPIAKSAPYRRLLNGLAGGVVAILGLAAISLAYKHSLYPIVRVGIGLYLAVCLGAASWAAVSFYRRTRSPVQRLQLRIMGVFLLLGMIPVIFLVVLPQMLLDRVEFVPFEIAISALALIPVGWAYTLVQPGLRGAIRRLQQFLTPFTIAVASFVLSASISNWILSVWPQLLRKDLWPMVVGMVVGVMIAVGFVVAFWFRRIFDVGDLRRSLLPMEETGAKPATSLETAKQEERLSLLTQLHDGPVQTATRLSFLLGLRKELSPEIKQQAEQLVLELRQLIRFSSVLQVLPENWMPNVRSLAADIERTGGIAISVLTKGGTEKAAVTPEIATALFYVIRESLYNVARHSKATECVVTISISEEMARLIVRDNGIGFDPKRAGLPNRGHFGLSSMRARVEHLGGSLNIRSSRSFGTEILVSMPLSQSKVET